ncbi:HlyD family type I secretion periplasmic adaptor subunit [Parasphingorhabdus sp.]|uniref:HlyD family type I secretion periplasmic adaptor subunit n=1 Tax=Parasphingorhabdus sp. TaxID=2709688 RepID=UPI003297CEE7
MTSGANPSNDAMASLQKTVRFHFMLTVLLLLILIGGLGAWAATQHISGAVVGSGTIVVESNIKEVQHREGGIVKAIHVQNGDLVEAGTLLVRLDDTVMRANLAVVTKQLTELTAQEIRLTAERDDLDKPVFKTGDASATGTNLSEIQRSQLMLFEARQAGLKGRIQQLKEQIGQYETQIEGLTAQLDAKATEIDLVDEELLDLAGLLTKQLVAKSRVTALRREQAGLQGEYGQLVSSIAQAKEAISEREIQILQLEEDTRAGVLEDLQDVRSRIAQLEEQQIAALDELSRVDIVAPQTGYVHQLAVHTVNGVIAPGETAMLIVPREDKLIVEAQIRPVDIDQLGQDQIARVRFPSFDQRTTPELTAKLLTVSPDLTEDERTGMTYYTARLVLDEDELAKLGDKVLVPGMPVEAFLTTQDRTVLSYLVKPVTDQIAHAMRER